jgi:hypothetical protein
MIWNETQNGNGIMYQSGESFFKLRLSFISLCQCVSFIFTSCIRNIVIEVRKPPSLFFSHKFEIFIIIIIIIIIIYLLQLGFHPVAVVLTLVHTIQMDI